MPKKRPSICSTNGGTCLFPASLNNEKKAHAGKCALACLVFTCMNPLRVQSWRIMTIHKKLPKDGLRIVIIPGKDADPDSTLYFRGPGSFKTHKFIGDLQLSCGTVLSKALHDFVQVSGDMKRTITHIEERIPKKLKYLFPSKSGHALPMSTFTTMVSRTFKKATGHHLCPQRC